MPTATALFSGPTDATTTPAGPTRWWHSELLFASLVAVSSFGFFSVCYSIFVSDPEYFERRLIASLPVERVDPITTGAVEAPPVETAEIPVPTIVRVRDPKAADYQIVTVFDGEAVLATASELMRVRVGSTLPGLGKILAIAETETGVTVTTDLATLTSTNR